MDNAIFLAGAIASALLLVLLALQCATRRLQIWPTPAPWSWQSVTFWPLFRIMNVAVIAITAVDLLDVEVMTPLQLAALGIAGASLSLYALGLASLGRENVYCGKAGLVTGGIYRWTRNPQYATIIPAYAGLAVAAQSLRGLLLAVLANTVFLAMAFAEENWLRGVYGAKYERYQAMVPRFYSFRRFGTLFSLHLARAWRRFLTMQQDDPLAPPLRTAIGDSRANARR